MLLVFIHLHKEHSMHSIPTYEVIELDVEIIDVPALVHSAQDLTRRVQDHIQRVNTLLANSRNARSAA
jgi:hypothetical protein